MSDYERVARAIEFVTRRAGEQPALEQIAAHVHLSPFHFQRLFSRWAGVTPKRFLQVLTVERAKELLGRARPLLDVSGAVGLSSGSRLHDHFVTLEAVTPGEFKTGGEGLVIEHAVHDTPFGEAFIAVTARGICRLSFLDKGGEKREIDTLARQWPHARLRENRRRTAAIVEAVFHVRRRPDRPLSLLVSGTNFQVSVWRALLRIPAAAVASYADVAAVVGRPTAARAVGLAVGSNPVAFLIPCHRVIQQSGRLGGYHWGETRKHAIHAWESARAEEPENQSRRRSRTSPA
jgi:AraC family transcriptional regulator of adaptative response/methylated-DNA-[protein]-cysteine methyltransferase